MVVHAFNQRTQEVEAGGLGVWDQPGLQECVKKNGGGGWRDNLVWKVSGAGLESGFSEHMAG